MVTDNMSVVQNQWQLQEAQDKLHQVVEEADKGVPQFISIHGRQTAVVLSMEAYRQLTQSSSSSLSEALLMPIFEEDESPFERNKDTGKAIDL